MKKRITSWLLALCLLAGTPVYATENGEIADTEVQSVEIEYTDAAESSDVIEVADEADATDVTEVADEAEDSDVTEVADEAEDSDVAEVADEAEDSDVTEVADEAEDSDVTEVADEAEDSDVTEVADEAEDSDVTEVVDEAEDSDVTEVTDEAEATDVTEVTDEAEAADVTEVTDEAEAADVTEVADEAEDSDVAEVTDEAEEAEITEASEAAQLSAEDYVFTAPDNLPVVYYAQDGTYTGDADGSVSSKYAYGDFQEAVNALEEVGGGYLILTTDLISSNRGTSNNPHAIEAQNTIPKHTNMIIVRGMEKEDGSKINYYIGGMLPTNGPLWIQNLNYIGYTTGDTGFVANGHDFRYGTPNGDYSDVVNSAHCTENRCSLPYIVVGASDGNDVAGVDISIYSGTLNGEIRTTGAWGGSTIYGDVNVKIYGGDLSALTFKNGHVTVNTSVVMGDYNLSIYGGKLPKKLALVSSNPKSTIIGDLNLVVSGNPDISVLADASITAPKATTEGEVGGVWGRRYVDFFSYEGSIYEFMQKLGDDSFDTNYCQNMYYSDNAAEDGTGFSPDSPRKEFVEVGGSDETETTNICITDVFTLNSDIKGIQPNYPIIRSADPENPATLVIDGEWVLPDNVVIKDIILKNGGNGCIKADGKELIIGEGVICEPDENGVYLDIYAGKTKNDSIVANVTVKSGTYQNIYANGIDGSDVNVYTNVKVIDSLHDRVLLPETVSVPYSSIYREPMNGRDNVTAVKTTVDGRSVLSVAPKPSGADSSLGITLDAWGLAGNKFDISYYNYVSIGYKFQSVSSDLAEKIPNVMLISKSNDVLTGTYSTFARLGLDDSGWRIMEFDISSCRSMLTETNNDKFLAQLHISPFGNTAASELSENDVMLIGNITFSRYPIVTEDGNPDFSDEDKYSLSCTESYANVFRKIETSQTGSGTTEITELDGKQVVKITPTPSDKFQLINLETHSYTNTNLFVNDEKQRYIVIEYKYDTETPSFKGPMSLKIFKNRNGGTFTVLRVHSKETVSCGEWNYAVFDLQDEAFNKYLSWDDSEIYQFQVQPYDNTPSSELLEEDVMYIGDISVYSEKLTYLYADIQQGSVDRIDNVTITTQELDGVNTVKIVPNNQGADADLKISIDGYGVGKYGLDIQKYRYATLEIKAVEGDTVKLYENPNLWFSHLNSNREAMMETTAYIPCPLGYIEGEDGWITLVFDFSVVTDDLLIPGLDNYYLSQLHFRPYGSALTSSQLSEKDAMLVRKFAFAQDIPYKELVRPDVTLSISDIYSHIYGEDKGHLKVEREVEFEGKKALKLTPNPDIEAEWVGGGAYAIITASSLSKHGIDVSSYKYVTYEYYYDSENPTVKASLGLTYGNNAGNKWQNSTDANMGSFEKLQTGEWRTATFDMSAVSEYCTLSSHVNKTKILNSIRIAPYGLQKRSYQLKADDIMYLGNITFSCIRPEYLPEEFETPVREIGENYIRYSFPHINGDMVVSYADYETMTGGLTPLTAFNDNYTVFEGKFTGKFVPTPETARAPTFKIDNWTTYIDPHEYKYVGITYYYESETPTYTGKMYSGILRNPPLNYQYGAIKASIWAASTDNIKANCWDEAIFSFEDAYDMYSETDSELYSKYVRQTHFLPFGETNPQNLGQDDTIYVAYYTFYKDDPRKAPEEHINIVYDSVSVALNEYKAKNDNDAAQYKKLGETVYLSSYIEKTGYTFVGYTLDEEVFMQNRDNDVLSVEEIKDIIDFEPGAAYSADESIRIFPLFIKNEEKDTVFNDIPKDMTLYIFENIKKNDNAQDKYVPCTDGAIVHHGLNSYYVVDGVVTINNYDSSECVSVVKEGYVTKTLNHSDILASNKVYLQPNPETFEDENGEIPINRKPVINEVKIDNIDVLTNKYVINPENDDYNRPVTVTYLVKWFDAGCKEVYLSQGDVKEYFNGNSLTINFVKSDFDLTEDIYIVAVDTNDSSSEKKLKIGVDTSFDAFLDHDITIDKTESDDENKYEGSISEDVPVIGGTELGVNIPSPEMTIITDDDGRFKIIIGIDVYKHHKGIKKYGNHKNNKHSFVRHGSDIDRIYSAVKSEVLEIKETENRDTALKKIKHLRNKYSNGAWLSKHGKFGFDNEFYSIGYAEGYIKDGVPVLLEGSYIINTITDITLAGNHISYDPPVRWLASVEGEGYGVLDLYIEQGKNGRYMFMPEGTVIAELSVNGTVDKGTHKSIKIKGGATGTLTATLVLSRDGDSFTVDGDINEDIEGIIGSYKLFDKKSHHKKGDGMWHAGRNAGNASLHSEEEASAVMLMAEESFAASLMSEIPSGLEFSDTYAYPEPCMAVIGDKVVAVWVAADESRNAEINKPSLYYSVYSDGEWSDKMAIENDGTADSMPSITSIDGKAYLVWVNSAKAFAGDETLTEVSSCWNISSAVFDGNTWQVSTVTQDDTLDISPTIFGNSGSIYSAWIQNETNSLFGTSNTNKILCSELTALGWSEPQEYDVGLYSVDSIAGAIIDNEPVIAYSARTTADSSANTNLEIFAGTNRLTDNDVSDTNVIFCGNKLYWCSDSSVYEYDFANKTSAIIAEGALSSDRFRVISDGVNTAIAVLNSGKLGAYFKDEKTGSFGGYVLISDNDAGTVKDFDGVFTNDGLMFLEASDSISESGYGETVLVAETLSLKKALEVTDFFYDKSSVKLSYSKTGTVPTIDFDFFVQNTGTLAIDTEDCSPYIKLVTENGNTLLDNDVVIESITFKDDVEVILPGETAEVIVRYNLFGGEGISCVDDGKTITVTPYEILVGFGLDEEPDEYESVDFRTAELSLSAFLIYPEKPGTVTVQGIVTNYGNVDSNYSDMVISVTDADGTVIDSIIPSPAASTQLGARNADDGVLTNLETYLFSFILPTDGRTVYVSVENNNGSFTETVSENNKAFFVLSPAALEYCIETTYEKVANGQTEDYTEYDIFLKGYGNEYINRLNSADLTFTIDVTDGNITYELSRINEYITFNNVGENRYEFHFIHKDGDVGDTSEKIKIARVRFEGYGSYTFGVDSDSETNVAYATKNADNIVDRFIPGGSADSTHGILLIAEKINDRNPVPKADLDIRIDFANKVFANNFDYQDMSVEISGGDLAERIRIKLGDNDSFDIAPTENGISVSCDDAGYSVALDDVLTKYRTYTVTISGEGYRTARYSVNLNMDKSLVFWNNVKDDPLETEQGNENSKALTNFLAGDIVKDSVINIYDLSAVVSYFGEINLSSENKPEYAKYDLNRDGKIDSKDVAYVLVSWGN